MSDKVESYEIMFAVYDTEDGAAGAIESLKAMDKANSIEIVDAATLVKDSEGNVTVKQESLPTIKKGIGIGALIGGAVGLLFPPAVLASAALGAGIGAGSTKLAQMALEDEDLKAAAEKLEPGTSAFIAVVDNTWVTQMQEVIAGYEDLATHTLDAEASGVIGVLASLWMFVVMVSRDARSQSKMSLMSSFSRNPSGESTGSSQTSSLHT